MWQLMNQLNMPQELTLSAMYAGVAGGSGYGFSAADTGATVAEIYNPTKPIGQRWSTVADSQILRFYHSTAILTSNATVRPSQLGANAEHLMPSATNACCYACYTQAMQRDCDTCFTMLHQQ